MIPPADVSTGHTSPDDTSPVMHVPSCADELPDHLDPIPTPDTEEEAWLLRLLLELGFYPKMQPRSEQKDVEDQGERRSIRSEAGRKRNRVRNGPIDSGHSMSRGHSPRVRIRPLQQERPPRLAFRLTPRRALPFDGGRANIHCRHPVTDHDPESGPHRDRQRPLHRWFHRPAIRNHRRW